HFGVPRAVEQLRKTWKLMLKKRLRRRGRVNTDSRCASGGDCPKTSNIDSVASSPNDAYCAHAVDQLRGVPVDNRQREREFGQCWSKQSLHGLYWISQRWNFCPLTPIDAQTLTNS